MLPFHFKVQHRCRVAYGRRIETPRLHPTLEREEIRQMKNLMCIENLGRDSRFASRQILRSPAFATTAILTLALGIGATQRYSASWMPSFYDLCLIPSPNNCEGSSRLRSVGASSGCIRALRTARCVVGLSERSNCCSAYDCSAVNSRCRAGDR